MLAWEAVFSASDNPSGTKTLTTPSVPESSMGLVLDMGRVDPSASSPVLATWLGTARVRRVISAMRRVVCIIPGELTIGISSS